MLQQRSRRKDYLKYQEKEAVNENSSLHYLESILWVHQEVSANIIEHNSIFFAVIF